MRRIRFALRSLAKSPLLRSVVVLSLGLGIGVNTAIFSLLYQVVLSALPIPHPEQLACTRLIESRLFGVHGKDAAIVTGIALLLSATAVAAAYWPARRASKVNPLEALRYE
jgi:ABC-type antimicrobial peptide transport system permease subunit